MIKILKAEDIRKMDLNILPNVLGKLTLNNLSQLYNYFKSTLDYSNNLISEVYTDSSKESIEMKIHKEQIYDKCMKNIKYSEIILFHIKNECDNRNIEQRFGISL